MSNGTTVPPAPCDRKLQEAIKFCTHEAYQMPDRPDPDWVSFFFELEITQPQLDCICQRLASSGIHPNHTIHDTRPFDLVEEMHS